MKKKIRMSTLVKSFGPITSINSLSADQRDLAVKENRVVTIHSSDEEGCADYGTIGYNMVNAVSRVAFNKTLPEGIEYVIGVKSEHYL